ncbi:unnamed protein product [Spirodela intermedia]|uniref:Uncharacterized protein n=2 Tax=Spirodela intermedia TaxID=51605 RepID=A0A7I8IYS7_SPIIN|nr:unnamed protein product [Spirodela intermedia]CAA6662872.1 unnamed protein product [Spirodela intermedia]CAA7399283.1 unnamed protein product [Spirodela intermedia]
MAMMSFECCLRYIFFFHSDLIIS